MARRQNIVRIEAVNKPAEAGKQDAVVLAVKAHFLDQGYGILIPCWVRTPCC